MRKPVIYDLLKSSIIILLFTLNSYGLNIVSDPNYSKYNLIYASGRFESGDLSRLKSVYNSLSDKSKQTIVVFNSMGGVLQEGIKIGKFLYRNHIGSAVQKGSYCASSCAIAFLGGRDRYGNKLMVLPRTSRLGYHNFYYKQANRVTQRSIQRDRNSVINYFSYVNASYKLMNTMLNTDSEDMYWVTHYSNRYIKNLRRRLPVSRRASRKYASNTTTSAKASTPARSAKANSQTDAMKRYFASINRAIKAKSNSKRGVAYNTTTTYKRWLESHLNGVQVKNIRRVSKNTIEAHVIYYLKNGLKVNSKNRYIVQQGSKGWQVVSKKVIPQRYARSVRALKNKLP